MDTPSSYPTYIYYFDGSSFRVERPEDLAHMWPGCADNPCAPFPEMAQGWRWKISHDEGIHGGPYAPDKTKYRHGPGIPLEGHVYAVEPLSVNDVQRNTFEVWRRGSPEVEAFIRAGVLHVVPPGALLAKSAKNGRCFLGDEARDVYDRRYDARDLTGFERDVPSPPDTASTLESEVAPRSSRGRGRPRSSSGKAPEPDFTERLKDLSLPLAQKWKKKLTVEHVYRSEVWIKWHNSSSKSTFYRLLDKHGIKWEGFKVSLLSQISQ